MQKYFYERGNFTNFKSNITYHRLLSMTDAEFVVWVKNLRHEMVTQWDTNGNPPVVGRDEANIIKALKKLKDNNCDFLSKDKSDDETSLGILKNFNKDASPVNQFFPTMMKTKIATGKSIDTALSIYDYFADPAMEGRFINLMKRVVRRDAMYSWSRTLVHDRDKNPFWNAQSPVDFIQDVHEGRIFNGEWSNCGIFIAKHKEKSTDDSSSLRLTADEVRTCVSNGWLTHSQTSNVDSIVPTMTLKSGKVNHYSYLIRWYEKDTPLFPKIHQVFKLSCGQPAVNFPALTAKWLYETHTNHIKSDEVATIYDSSAGWGGRIIGAMSSRRKIHYVGTDPNSDNLIDDLGISRYEYVADFYNQNCLTDGGEVLSKFFKQDTSHNTYDIFNLGSEVISQESSFQKYKGKLDLAFTSPPYFNRERYGEKDTGQSWDNFRQYDTWRDEFLRPTLTTIYEYLASDRYILWNIADIKIGKDLYYPLEQDSIDIIQSLGGVYTGKYKMLMTNMIGVDASSTSVKNTVKFNTKWYKYEPIFCFHKK